MEPFGTCPGMILLDGMSSSCSLFSIDVSTLIFIVAVSVDMPINSEQEFSFFELFHLFIFCKIVILLTGMSWTFKVVLICIFLSMSQSKDLTVLKYVL